MASPTYAWQYGRAGAQGGALPSLCWGRRDDRQYFHRYRDLSRSALTAGIGATLVSATETIQKRSDRQANKRNLRDPNAAALVGSSRTVSASRQCPLLANLGSQTRPAESPVLPQLQTFDRRRLLSARLVLLHPQDRTFNLVSGTSEVDPGCSLTRGLVSSSPCSTCRVHCSLRGRG